MKHELHFDSGNSYIVDEQILDDIAYRWFLPPKDFCNDVQYSKILEEPGVDFLLNVTPQVISVKDWDTIEQIPSQRFALAYLFMKLWKIFKEKNKS